MSDLLERSTFDHPQAGAPVPTCCAISGGPDSMALLVLAAASGPPVTAIHVDHQLWAGSAEAGAAVAALADRVGAGFRSESAPVEPGPNLEARARYARYQALPVGALTGHTADDQAETVLLNLLRGAGLAGLGGMAADGRRPLLGLRRADTRQLCTELGLDPVDDPANHDPAFRRNRVRHELLALMGDIADRDPVPILARQAALLRDDAELLAGLAADIDPTDAAAVREAPVPLARIALRRWIVTEAGWDHPPDAAAIDRVLEVAQLDAGATDVGSGWRVHRRQGRLRLALPDRGPDLGY